MAKGTTATVRTLFHKTRPWRISTALRPPVAPQAPHRQEGQPPVQERISASSTGPPSPLPPPPTLGAMGKAPCDGSTARKAPPLASSSCVVKDGTASATHDCSALPSSGPWRREGMGGGGARRGEGRLLMMGRVSARTGCGPWRAAGSVSPKMRVRTPHAPRQLQLCGTAMSRPSHGPALHQGRWFPPPAPGASALLSCHTWASPAQHSLLPVMRYYHYVVLAVVVFAKVITASGCYPCHADPLSDKYQYRFQTHVVSAVVIQVVLVLAEWQQHKLRVGNGEQGGGGVVKDCSRFTARHVAGGSRHMTKPLRVRRPAGVRVQTAEQGRL